MPFRHVFLTPTCHVSGFPLQVINVDAWIWWWGLLYNLCNLVATLHKSHINHCYNETRTSPSVFSAPTLTELDLGLLGWLLELNADSWLITAMVWTRLLVAYSFLLWSDCWVPTLIDFLLSKSTLLNRSSGLVREHLVQGVSFLLLLKLLS
jgi:hypothetical protein